VLHLQDVFVVLEVLETDGVVLLEQLLKLLLLILVLLLQLLVLVDVLLVLLLEIRVLLFDFLYLVLQLLDLFIDLLLVLLVLLLQPRDEGDALVLSVFQDVRVLDLHLLVLLVELVLRRNGEGLVKTG